MTPESGLQTLLEMKEITKTFPGVRALDGVSFDLYAGGCTRSSGDGAGKSTLMKVGSGRRHPQGSPARDSD